MNITKQDLEIFEKIKESHSADDWAESVDIWGNAGFFYRPEWRLHRLYDLGLMERKLEKLRGYYDWKFRIKVK